MKISGWLYGNSFGILLLRVFVGIRLIYGVLDNILSWENMIEFSVFLESFGFPLPLICAIVSVYSQFLAAVLILIGYQIRLFSSLMVFNFLIALLFVHFSAGHTIEEMTPALAMLIICLTFVFTGAEDFSLDGFFRELNKVPTDFRTMNKNQL